MIELHERAMKRSQSLCIAGLPNTTLFGRGEKERETVVFGLGLRKSVNNAEQPRPVLELAR